LLVLISSLPPYTHPHSVGKTSFIKYTQLTHVETKIITATKGINTETNIDLPEDNCLTKALLEIGSSFCSFCFTCHLPWFFGEHFFFYFSGLFF